MNYYNMKLVIKGSPDEDAFTNLMKLLNNEFLNYRFSWRRINEDTYEVYTDLSPKYFSTLAKRIVDAGYEVDDMTWQERLFFMESKDERYFEPTGRFKQMTCPDETGHKSRFCGCVRYMMSKRGLSLDAAKKVCAYIARHKKK